MSEKLSTRQQARRAARQANPLLSPRDTESILWVALRDPAVRACGGAAVLAAVVLAVQWRFFL